MTYVLQALVSVIRINKFMYSAITAQNLSKEFVRKRFFLTKTDKILAVNNISFNIKRGESVAFMGQNGAGKSTTIKLLCGILQPTSGDCYILGNKPGSTLANRTLGIIMGNKGQLWIHLMVKQSLNILAEIYGITGKEKSKRISELSELFEITNLLDQRVLTLSLGQRMRCELVASLIHYPSILLADEPTIGLDVTAKSYFRTTMKRWQEEKKITLLLTSHDCTDVQLLCDRAILIDRGMVRYDGLINGLKGHLEYVKNIVVILSEEVANISLDNEYVTCKPLDSYRWNFEFSTKNISVIQVINYLSTLLGDKIIDIAICEVSLEEVIRDIFKEIHSN